MKTWNGKPLYVCSVCGYATVDPPAFTEHERISGHKQPETVIEPVEVQMPEEVIEEKPVSKKKKLKADETAELENISEVNNE